MFYSLTASKRAEVCLSGHILVHYGAADDTTFNPFPNGTIKIKFHRAGKTTWRNYITQKSFLKEEEGKKASSSLINWNTILIRFAEEANPPRLDTPGTRDQGNERCPSLQMRSFCH